MDSDRSRTPLNPSPSRREKRESLPGIGKSSDAKGSPVNQSIESIESMSKRVTRESQSGQQTNLPTGKALDTLAAQTFKRHDRYNQGNLEKDVILTALGEIAAPFGLTAKEALDLDSERCKLKRYSLADFVSICSRLSMQHVQRLRDERIKNTGAIKTQIPPGADSNPDLQLVFESYCTYTAGIAKDPGDSGIGILTQQLNKLCLDIGLLSTEGGPLNVSEMDIAFARVKAPNSRRVTYPQWLVLLCILTDKSGWDLFKMMEEHAQKLGQKAGVPPPSFTSEVDRKKILPPLEESSFGGSGSGGSSSARMVAQSKSEGGVLADVTGPPASNLKPIADYRPKPDNTSDPLWMTQVLDRLTRLEAARGSVPPEGSDMGRLIGALEGGVEFCNQAVGGWSSDGPSLLQEITEMRLQMSELKSSNVAKAKEVDKLVARVKELEASEAKKPPVDSAALEARIMALEQLSQKQAARLKELQATSLSLSTSTSTITPPAEASANENSLEPRVASLELQIVALEKKAKKEAKDQESADASVADQIVSHHEHIQAHASRLEEMAQLLSMTQDSVQDHTNLIHELEAKVNSATEDAASAQRRSLNGTQSIGRAPLVDIETKADVEELQSKMHVLEDKVASKLSLLESLSERQKDLHAKVGQLEKQCIQMDKQQMILQQQYHAVAATATQRPSTSLDSEASDSRFRRTNDQINQLASRIQEVEAKSRANTEALLISMGLTGLSEKVDKRISALEMTRQDNELLAEDVSKLKQKHKQKTEALEGDIEAIKEKMASITKTAAAAAAVTAGTDAADSVASKKVLSELKSLRDEVGKLSEDVNIKLTTRLTSTTTLATEAVDKSDRALADASKALEKVNKATSSPTPAAPPPVDPESIRKLSEKINELESDIEVLRSANMATLRAPSSASPIDRSKGGSALLRGGEASNAILEEAAKRSSQANQSIASLRTEVDALNKDYESLKTQMTQLMSISAVTSTQLGTTQQHVQSVTNLAENLGKELAELKASGGILGGASTQRYSSSGGVNLPPNRTSFGGADAQELSRLSGSLPPGLLEFIEQDHNALIVMQSDIQQLAVAIGEVAGRFVAVEKDIGEALSSYVRADDFRGMEGHLYEHVHRALTEMDQIKLKVMEALSMRPVDYVPPSRDGFPSPSREGLASGGGDSLGPLPSTRVSESSSNLNKSLAPSAKVSMRYQNWLDQKSTSSNGRLRTPLLSRESSDSGQNSILANKVAAGFPGGGRTRFGHDSSKAETLIIDEASSYASMTPEGSQVFGGPVPPKLPRLTTPDHEGPRSSNHRARFSSDVGGSGGGAISGGGGQEKIQALEGQIKRVHDAATEKLELHSQAIMHMAKQIDVLQETINSPAFNPNPAPRTVRVTQSMNNH